ncbi:hypothetical protein COB21_05415 [Candidatus Aerophobetes bacterium]|uniref:Uncharacterized protein n=1 Tax=Aerophobetes bacterium TaxID=2030807 RepID=A0A2A4X0Q3_UNCAE|nr:MAG: hypothetical protein COB21_05415 [Candidatus Aerophobetes bacterium]
MLFPSCGVDEPFQYIVQMHGYQIDKKVIEVSASQKGYQYIKKIGRKLLYKKAVRQRIKKVLDKLTDKKNGLKLSLIYKEASFPQTNYDVVWDRFLDKKLEVYYKQFIKSCNLKWCNNQTSKIDAKEFKKSLIIVDADRLADTLPECFYCVLCSDKMNIDRLLKRIDNNLFFVFDNPLTRACAAKKNKNLHIQSMVIPTTRFYPKQTVLSNRSYIQSLVYENSRTKFSAVKNLNKHIVLIDIDLNQSQEMLHYFNQFCLSHEDLLWNFVYTSDQKIDREIVKKYPNICFLEEITADQQQAMRKEASVFFAGLDSREAYDRAISAGYYNTCVIATDSEHFRWLFEEKVQYVQQGDFRQVCQLIDSTIKEEETSTIGKAQELSNYVKSRFSIYALKEEIRRKVFLRYMEWKQK